MNGKYPGRGGSSYRGSPMGSHGQYGGYYHDPYYNSSPVSRRGGSRGRNSSAGGYYGSPGLYSNISYIPPSSSSSNSENNISNANSNSNNNTNNNANANSSNGNINTNPSEQANNSYHAPSSGSDSVDIQGGKNFDNSKWSGHYNSEYSGRGRGGYSAKFTRGGIGRMRGRGGSSRGSWSSGRGGGNAGYYYSNINNVNGNGGYEGISNKQAQRPYYHERDDGIYDGKRNGNIGHETGDGSIEHQHHHSHPHQQHPQQPIQSNDDAALQKDPKRRKLDEESKLQSGHDLVRERELERKKESEFKEKHWINRIHVQGELKQNLIKCFDELDSINSNLLDVGARRVELEMDINRYNRILKGEDDRIRLAEEQLESMNLTI